MVGFDDHIANGDWVMPPTPSPRTIFSSIASDDNGGSGRENTNMSLFPGPEGHGMFGNAEQKDQKYTSAETNGASISDAPAEPKPSYRGGLMERRAGFNAPKLNTGSIRPAELSNNSEVRSPGFVLSPGLSPTLLLESPVFLSNSLVLPSPTTGKFCLATSGNNQNPILVKDDSDKGRECNREDGSDTSFAFKPVAESSSFPYFSMVSKGQVNHSGFAPQSFANAGFSFPSSTPASNQSLGPHFQSQNNGALLQQANFSESHVEKNRDNSQKSEETYNAAPVIEDSPPLDEPQEDDEDRRSGGDANIGNSPADDGFNWRKYGQKQVKGSEYPRSYYKCTQPNCPVKKKVERSHEGHITEIIYKGAHNHPKPPPSRRSTGGSSGGPSEMQLNSEQIGTDASGGLHWSSMQNGNEEYNNGTAHFQGQSGVKYETVDGADGSSAFSNDEDDEDRATRGSASLGYDGEGDELESKRRKVESYASDLTGASRAIREPRVVVQTTSEVDILDDGYRWRKYGQKVVKGNPNPRSYYKCTSTGCNVRKHVERACHDLKSVITTYEGKHNHDVPAARNSNHLNSGGPSFPTQQAPSAASTHIHRPEPSQLRGSMPQHNPFRSQMGPGGGFGYGMNHQSGLAGLGMARLGSNEGRLPMNPYLTHQQQQHGVNDMSLMVPKDEPRPEAGRDSGANATSNQALLYQQFMNRLPLGPQM